MSEASVAIVADTREPAKVMQKLESLQGVSLERRELDVGDYVLPGGAVIERKSATDLILSVVDQSLWDKVSKLRASYERVVYIVEGDLYTARFHQKALDIHRALADMVIHRGVSVLPSPDGDNSAMLIYLMALQAAAETDKGQRTNKPTIRRDAQLYILEGLPGIDADRAEALLRRFKSAGRVMQADVAALAEVEGVDEATAARIVEVVNFGV
jgi:DNA excision repair protein ERCC-4/Fanconi anemia group M protein